MSSARSERTVTVIGLGLMGSALARALLVGGCKLTVWNRTPEKAEPFAASAQVADSVTEACVASQVVVVSLLDYQAGDGLLRRPDVEEALSGKVLVQLTSGTPSDARDAEAWARASGFDYLDGAIMGYPSSIGGENTTILYSGSKRVFEDNLELLKVLAGDPVFCGEAAGAAAALDMAVLVVLYGVVGAILHGAALCASESVTLADFLGHISGGLVPAGLAEMTTEGVEVGAYPAGNSTMITNAAACRLVVRASQEAGVDVSLPQALSEIMMRTISLGHGEDDWPAMYEGFRRRPDHTSS